QYITHTASFYGLDLYVDKNVLIPRPETEILVETVLKKLSASNSPPVIIDWGSGSGNIAIAIARNLNCQIYATDISAGALKIAKKNVKRFRLTEMVKLFKGEGFKSLPKRLRGKIDAVVANPPYVCPGERKSLPVEVKDFEPELALFDKKDGLYFTEEIISHSNDFLKPGGLIALETALGLAKQVAALLRENGNYAEIEVVKDLAGIERHVLARKKTNQ
ncbi:MAG: peptide chain release factor N(5)-glutamine methyltransferase, partial [candidate division Zixibacteria bacterium]|nr:peptide chain release factor N(5)-glutamine methyltransferase [candidate division Zixibacteria bacterium]